MAADALAAVREAVAVATDALGAVVEAEGSCCTTRGLLADYSVGVVASLASADSLLPHARPHHMRKHTLTNI